MHNLSLFYFAIVQKKGKNMKLKYSLTDDICFKYVFRNEKILTSLLNSFFSYIHADKSVVEIEITTQKEMIGSKRENKAFYGDILAYLDTNEIVSIEMYKKVYK